MHATPRELPVTFATGESVIRSADWDDLRALFVALPAGTDRTPLLQDVPDDLCQCPHWGDVRKGQLDVTYADPSKSFKAGISMTCPQVTPSRRERMLS
jgi:hypothetical protein